jgi:hypothetical protein
VDPLRLLALLAGVALVGLALRSALHTFVLPRSANDAVTRAVFVSVRLLFELANRRARTYAERDRVMALYAPTSLLALVPAWLVLVLAGYSGLFYSAGRHDWLAALTLSGSSLLTLGFAQPSGAFETGLAVSEAAIGLILVALLIAYLPTMYTAFARREAAVALLEVRAGSPPTGVELILRYNRIATLEDLNEIWPEWEAWFVDIDESHTSLAALAFFRSPQPDRSWVTAAGAVLDAASLVHSTVDVPRSRETAMCIRAGYVALRRIADVFRVDYDPDPRPGDPISISRDEYEAACAQLAAGGVPLRPDREQTWLDFAGWRVNYDRVLLALAALTIAPYAPWSSDRSLPIWGRERRPAKTGR